MQAAAEARTRPGRSSTQAMIREQRAQIFFRRAGRIHIPSLLTDSVGGAITARLATRDPLGPLPLNYGSGIQDFVNTPQEREPISLAAWGRAYVGFQFLGR